MNNIILHVHTLRILNCNQKLHYMFTLKLAPKSISLRPKFHNPFTGLTLVKEGRTPKKVFVTSTFSKNGKKFVRFTDGHQQKVAQYFHAHVNPKGEREWGEYRVVRF